MTKVLVLYYSTYGHVETMAYAVAEGVREAAPKQWSSACRRRSRSRSPRAPHFKLDQPAPVATVAELPEYDAIIFGVPTRYGNMAGQMRSFFDQTGEPVAQGALIGKVGSVFASTATQHGGQETTMYLQPLRPCCISAW